MKKALSLPLISVCIPVFDTERFLFQCLHSVAVQDFENFEVVIVSDASCGRDEKGRSAKKIVKLAQKECTRLRKERKLPPVSFRFIEHKENRGILEVRRTLTFEARGRYIASLDSDDEYIPGALSAFYEAAKKTEADIVHAAFISGVFDKEGNFIQSEIGKCETLFNGIVDNKNILSFWLKGEFTANLCGKLIERNILLKAFDQIPYTECNMADDVLIFFFAAINARRYTGIDSKLYRYRVNSGMSSSRKIDTLHKWKMVCSAASVFTVISQWIQEHKTELLPDEIDHVRKMTGNYLINNLKQMKETVIPELQKEARTMLCDYWGAGFVEKMEKLK